MRTDSARRLRIWYARARTRRRGILVPSPRRQPASGKNG